MYLTYHISYSIRLNLSSFPCFCVHPVQILQVSLERVPNVVDHDLALSLRFAVEYFADEHGTHCETCWGIELVRLRSKLRFEKFGFYCCP